MKKLIFPMLAIVLLLSLGFASTIAAIAPPVSIDIKPCSDPNSVNLNSKGDLPVAILTDDAFDATTVDWTTVTLDGIPAMRGNIEDACMEDGDLDLVVHFSIPALAAGPWSETTTEATLVGTTYDGIPIMGMDYVRIVTKGPHN